MGKRINTITAVACMSTLVACAKTQNTDKAETTKAPQAAAAEAKAPKMPKVDPKAWDFLPKVVATVGKTEITKEQLVKAADPQIKMMMSMGRSFTPQQYQEIAKTLTDELIKVQIIKDLAAKDGYKLDPSKVDEMYAKFASKFEKQLPKGQKMSFDDAIKKQGLNLDDVKKQIAEGEVIQNWIKDKIQPTVKVSDKDIKEFYEKNKDQYFKTPETVEVAHILVRPVLEKDGKKLDEKQAWADAKTKADKLFKEVKDNGDFAKIAKEQSDDKASGANGGELGKVAKGQMVPEFEKAAFELGLAHAGDKTFSDYSEVKTQFGWHIIKVYGYDKGGFQKLDSKLEEQIKAQLEQVKLGEDIKGKIDTEMKKLNPVVNFKVETPKEAKAVDTLAKADVKEAKDNAPQAKTAEKEEAANVNSAIPVDKTDA